MVGLPLSSLTVLWEPGFGGTVLEAQNFRRVAVTVAGRYYPHPASAPSIFGGGSAPDRR